MMRASANALIRAAKPATLAHPFSLFSSNLNNVAIYNQGKLEIDFSRVRDVDDAISLFREMMSITQQPSVFKFTKLLNAIVKMNQYTVALSVFDEMRQKGAPLNEYAFSIAMNCYCLLNRVDFGFAILGSFFKHGYEPNNTTFTKLIKGLFSNGKSVEAEKLFKKMLDQQLCEPNDVMIATLTNGLCKAGNTRAACYYLELLGKSGYNANVYAYSTAIDSLCKGGMVEDGLQLLWKMIGRGILPNVITYTSMIHGLCGAGRWEDMRDLLYKMIDEKMSLNVVTFNVLVNMLCKKGKLEEAEDLVEIMKQQNVSPDVYTCTTLIDGYCSRGQMDRAEELLDYLVDQGFMPNMFAYSSLINGYCKNGKVDEAWRVFVEIPCKGLQHTTGTYNTMIHGLLSEGRLGDGWKLFNDMEA